MEKGNCKKYLTLFISVMVVLATALSSFADTVDVNNKEKQERQERRIPENMIIGKITSIDATNVTIQIATRNEIGKVKFEKDGNHPVKKTDEKQKQDEINQKEKPNIDEMFNLTGETKTINIASADFGKNMPQFDKNATKESREEAIKNITAKTYQDYKVGDYIIIEATDNTYTTAKKISDMMRGGMVGRFRGDDKKDKSEKSKKAKSK